MGRADCSKDSQPGGPLGLLQVPGQPHSPALLDIADMGILGTGGTRLSPGPCPGHAPMVEPRQMVDADLEEAGNPDK